MKAAVGVFLFLGMWVSAQVVPKPPAAKLIITNVNVVNTRQGTIDRHMTVVIKKGRIVTVAKVGLLDASRSYQIINAGGRYLIPGLWDMHVHSAFADNPWDENLIYPLYIANGVTGIRDMGGDPDMLMCRRARIDRGELLGPHMWLAGPFLAGSKADRQTIQVRTAEEARAAVNALQKRGVDFIKILSNIPRDAYFAIAEQATKDKLRFEGHIPYSVSATEASAAGQRSIEHLGEILLACSSQEDQLRKQRLDALARRDYAAFNAADMQATATYDKDKAWKLFVELANHNNWQVPTLVWTKANANLDSPDEINDPRLQYVPASVRQQWDPAKQWQGTTSQQIADDKMQADRLVELAGAMLRAGVPFLAGTDGPDPYVYPGFSLHDEMAWMVKAGFSPFQALQSATFYPALFMTELDKFGVVEPGHVADLVLLDENPLEDISNTRKISGMVVDGAYYSPAELEKLKSDAAALAAAE